MNIAFFGTPPFTTDFLDTLKTSGCSPSLIVTGPNRPVGRGMKLQSPAPKVWGDEHGIRVLQPEKLDGDFFATLSEIQWDLFVVVAYGKIMPEHIINLPKYGTINVHYSLLPKYRGATPVESAILNGDSTTGIAIQQMVYKLDAGAILASKEITIDPADTTSTLRTKLNNEALTMLPEVIKQIETKTIAPETQDESLATSCKKITKEDGEISLDDDPVTLDRKWRAYQPWPGLYFFKDGKRIKITKAHLADGAFVIEEIIPENGKRIPFTAQ